jgi:hypothetical protein
MRVIPSNSATAALRRIAFTLVDATDLITPEDITVTGVKVSLSIDGGTPANSTNDIVKVAGSTGEYYLELTQAEANQTAGAVVRGTLTPSGCALAKMEAQIGPAEVFAATVTIADGGLTAAKFAASAITSTVLADNAITAAKIAGDAITDAKIAASAVTEIQAGLATSAEIAALDTVVDRVETDTQDIQSRLPAALSAGRMVANAQAIGGVPVGEGGVAPGSPIGEV